MRESLRLWFAPDRLRGVGETPDYRFSLANERTFLAWIRTALALVGGGLAVAQFLDGGCLREGVAVAVTVRCIEYLGRRKSAVAPSYDRLLATTPALDPWHRLLEQLRAQPSAYRHVDVGGLVKYALALGRTFPDRLTTLLYLFWEPLDANQFDEFRRHRAELATLGEAVSGGRVRFEAKSFESLWREWTERRSPPWLASHVARLRARYSVSIAASPAV